MKTLSFKAKIAMVIITPIMFTFSVFIFAILYLFKIIFWIFNKSGITEALTYLGRKIREKQKFNSFMESLSEDDKKTMSNG